MKGRNVVFTLLLILALLAFAVVRRWQEPRVKEVFSRNVQVQYTAFAICQMHCKNISEKAVAEVLQKGIILFNKSNRRRWPCPSYTVQARTRKGRRLRVVFEQCQNKTVALAIDDLGNDTSCPCAENR